MPPFRKRTFTARTLFHASSQLMRYLPGLVWAYLFRGINPAFAERILLVISGVNACRYCSWFHSHMAIKSGIEPAEIDQLLQQLIPQSCDKSETAALGFALHYAESNGRPTSEHRAQLPIHYNHRQVNGILGLCAAIHFGNLSGNTFDAFLYRWRGQPATDSSLLMEILFFIFCAPFLLPLMPRIRDRG